MTGEPVEPPAGGVLPATFDVPTLGRAVRLGELYDQPSGKFLGVQLYAENKVKEIETDIKHTELSVSLSTTHQQKATVLDIKAQLSLSILGGLIKVSGSASYLNDEKSNTNEYAYALALKMRLNEKRILFAEPDLGRNVLEIAEKDYINPKLATHFVSAIVYGGSYIVNLVARQSEMSKEEKIEGKLQASFDKLKGAISLDGSVDANIEGKFDDMDDKFDLVVHGDVALDKVPITPKDVLDTFPKAASLITKSEGVPISVTLQPIPPGLYKGSFVYEIEENIVDLVLAAFSDLDDLRSRFLVLQDSVKRLQDFVPELAQVTRTVSAAYNDKHGELLQNLAVFLHEYKLGEHPEYETLLCKVERLYNKHVGSPFDRKCGDEDKEGGLNVDDDRVSARYPSYLAGLENEFSRFQHLITDIRTVMKSFGSGPATADASFYLSTLEDVSRAIGTQKDTLLFIMVPVSGDGSTDLKVLQYLAIVRKYSMYFQESVNAAHMFYAESLADLERRFPNNKTFAELKDPTVFAARVDEEGNLKWDAEPPVLPPSSSAQTLSLRHKPARDAFGSLSLAIDDVDGTKAYTIHIRAKEGPAPDPPLDTAAVSPSPYFILLLERGAEDSKFLSFRKGFGVQLEANAVFIKSAEDKKPDYDKEFTATFVQDTLQERWILYLDGDEIAREPFTGQDIIQDSTKLRITYPPSLIWWDGELLEVQAFARALSKEQVKALAVNSSPVPVEIQG